MIQKNEWRQIFLERRKAIPFERRKNASALILEKLKMTGKVLSFEPIGSEIDISPLNQMLKEQGRLHIPKIIGNELVAPFEEFNIILVPGIGFDTEGFRIGYGKGYYDRFLAKAKNLHSIGIAFKEQLCEELLPKDPWDIPVKELILV